MEQIYERVAGCDVHRDQVTVCVRTPGPRGGVHKDKARFKTTTAGLIEMADWCGERAVELVAMEATGVYWKPVYYALEDRFQVWLCNAYHVKNVPGRKTDLLTELPGPDSRVGVRLPIGVATFPAHEQRRGWVAGVVRVGCAAGRVARGDRGPV